MPPSNLTRLESIVHDRAVRRGFLVGFDTHYDAGNVVARRWAGLTLHRLDFQPLEGDLVQVTLLADVYPFMPRLLRWCERTLPLFPQMVEVTYRNLGQFHPAALSDAELTARVDALLDLIP